MSGYSLGSQNIRCDPGTAHPGVTTWHEWILHLPPACYNRFLGRSGQHTQRLSNEDTIYRCVGEIKGTSGEC